MIVRGGRILISLGGGGRRRPRPQQKGAGGRGGAGGGPGGGGGWGTARGAGGKGGRRPGRERLLRRTAAQGLQRACGTVQNESPRTGASTSASDSSSDQRGAIGLGCMALHTFGVTRAPPQITTDSRALVSVATTTRGNKTVRRAVRQKCAPQPTVPQGSTCAVPPRITRAANRAGWHAAAMLSAALSRSSVALPVSATSE